MTTTTRLGTLVMLAALLSPGAVHAQSLADSVQIIATAVRGFATPNGPLTEMSPLVGCLQYRRPIFCDRPPAGERHSPTLLAELSLVLGLPAGPAGPGDLICPWAAGLSDRPGLAVEVGRLEVVSDSAVVYVEIGCATGYPVRGFEESAMVYLHRNDTVWRVARMTNHLIT